MSKITRLGAQKHTEMNTRNLRRKKIKLEDDNRIVSAFPSTEEALVNLLSSALLFRIATVRSVANFKKRNSFRERDYLK